ncbi:MAG TPA: MFS transporter [Stellaceae bacterium]|jgi:MHS family proline/betaine transporter-like MFS transporter|nr:MFS transporter [Stellaceae bacterium]
MTAAAIPAAGSSYQRAITAGVIGNVLEWYDYGVYGYLVPIISQLFFPSGDATVSLLSTFAVFGVGFVMRPVGSIVFGVYGDRHGRRKALSAVIFVMAASTFAMGLLPTYAQAGIAGPALMVIVRLFQGLSTGGEFGGSSAYIVEYAPQHRRGFFGAFQLVGVATGFLCGSLTSALLNSLLTKEELTTWGWRLPFLFGLAVGVIGAYMRWKISDTPIFTDIEEHGQTAKAPFVEAITQHPKETLLAFTSTLHNTVAFYIALIYMNNYMINIGKLPQPTALWISTAGLAFMIVQLPFWGALSDRVGRRPLMIFSCAAYIVLGYPFFLLMSSGDVTLAVIGELLMMICYAPYAATCASFLTEIIPTRVRYTSMSFGYNVSVAIFGGFAPFIATWLVRGTGLSYSPGFYLMAAAVVTGIAVLRCRETAFEPLR